MSVIMMRIRKVTAAARLQQARILASSQSLGGLNNIAAITPTGLRR
jgi:hypothetical protein